MKLMLRCGLAALLVSAAGFALSATGPWPVYNDQRAQPVFNVDQTGAYIGGAAAIPVSGTGGLTAVTVGTTSALASAAATRTARLVIKNESTNASIACNLGATAALNTAGSLTIQPGQMLTLSDSAYVPGDAVNCIASAASTPATVWSK